jgi:hypothetical protein
MCNHPIIKTFTSEDTIQHKISVLKREGMDINTQWFKQILKSVNKINNIDINLHPIILSERNILEKKIQNLKEKQAPVICNPAILTAFTDLIDTFDTIRDDNESYLKMQSFLDDNIEVFQSQILEFLSTAGFDKDIESFFDNITKWKTRGEEIYMTQHDETSLTLFTFYNIFIKNMMLIYPNMIINSTSYENISLPKHWKISDRHVKELKKNVFSEVSSLHKFYGDKDLFAILKYVQEQSKDIIDLMKSTTLFADLILKDKIAPTIMNGTIINKLSQFYLMCNISIYIQALETNLFNEHGGELDDLLDVANAEGTRIKQQQNEGKKDEIKKKIANLLNTYLTIMNNQKNKLDINKEDIIKKVLKSKEKEKNKVTKRLGDLTVEEREVENIKKNQRLGAWGLGQTRALYEYDALQYDKERQEIDNEMLMESRLDKRADVTIENRDVCRTEELQEQAQEQLTNIEMMNELFALGDDDDFGDIF